jgi:hypothetical protein
MGSRGGTGPALLAALILAGCLSSPVESIRKLEDVYRLRVTSTRATYAPGDSVVVMVENGDFLPYRWHRCPGIRLQRETASGKWAEVSPSEDCTDGLIGVPPFGYILIAFIMPLEASPGRYRVLVALSAPIEGPFVFWWPGSAFQVAAS